MSEALKKPNSSTPESYSPKNKPEILRMAEQNNVVHESQTHKTPATSTIPQEKRNSIRIIEFPACKMVTSGPIRDMEIFERFGQWFSEFDKHRVDMFYNRDFMWSNPDGVFEWGYAVAEVPEDTGGFEVIDFPGGLFAVAISVDADGSDHDRVYENILDWVNNSGCFVLDENDKRRSLGNVTSPQSVKDIMGYAQMDLYFPVAIKEAEK